MREVNPMDTDRAKSWQLYIDAPMPMVTIFKTLDISNLMRQEKAGYKLNMLLCYCICLAANDTKEFQLLPVGKKMMEYEKIGQSRSLVWDSCDVYVSVIVERLRRRTSGSG